MGGHQFDISTDIVTPQSGCVGVTLTDEIDRKDNRESEHRQNQRTDAFDEEDAETEILVFM